MNWLRYPFEIFTDQGRNFESELFQKVCELLQIRKSPTTPYRPSGKGQVERYNRTLMDAVCCFMDNHVNTWYKHLGLLAGAMRSAVDRHTGIPLIIMLGCEVNNPTTLRFKPPPGEGLQNRGRKAVIHTWHEKKTTGNPRSSPRKSACCSEIYKKRL